MAHNVNISQSKIIDATEGPVLVIAGPGSGKTFTLVERTQALLEKKQIDPSKIFISTFTEKAAAELKSRISKRVQSTDINISELEAGTLHSIFLRIIEDYREHSNLKRGYRLVDQFEQQFLIYRNLQQFLDIEHIEELLSNNLYSWNNAASLATFINKANEEALKASALINGEEPPIQALGHALNIYQDILTEHNILDFSTIQNEMLNLLENPLLTEKIQNRYQYIMVDEYQDTNTIQEKILLKLAEKHNNICVVGDDDQALYRFRNATIRNILEFPFNFADTQCQTFYLTQNYRSTPDIIEFFNKWMTKTIWSFDGKQFRHDKKITPVNVGPSSMPSSPHVFKVSGQLSQDNWSDEVIAFLHHLRDKNIITDWNQAAFLFNSVRNPKALALASKLEEQGIKVYSPRSKLFFKQTEIRLMIGALLFLFPQYALNRAKENRSFEIWAYYDDCTELFMKHIESGEDEPLKKWAISKAQEHLSLTENLDGTFLSYFYELLRFKTFASFLDEKADGSVVDSRPARNLAQLSRLLNKFEYLYYIDVLAVERIDQSLASLFNTYFRFLFQGGIDEYEDEQEPAPSGCISFMTIHQSKGLEFPLVMVGSLDTTPRKQYGKIDELLQSYYEKEPFEPMEQTKYFDYWRLFYTAFSRAETMLVLSCQEHKGKPRRSPSKAIESVYEDLPIWKNIDFSLDEYQLKSVSSPILYREYAFTSDILNYQTCPMQYRFYRDLDFAPVRTGGIVFGTVVHQTIEDIHKAYLEGKSEQITDENINDWFESNYYYLTKRERSYLAPAAKNIALKHVKNYVQKEQANWHRLHETEVELKLLKDTYVLKGTIDLVEASDSSYEIIDFKTEKKPDLYDTKDQDKLRKYRQQLQIYAHLLEESRNIRISKMSLYHTGTENGNPKISWDRDLNDVQSTIDGVDQTIQKIQNKNYQLTERPKQNICKECDIRHYCDMHLQIKPCQGV